MCLWAISDHDVNATLLITIGMLSMATAVGALRSPFWLYQHQFSDQPAAGSCAALLQGQATRMVKKRCWASLFGFGTFRVSASHHTAGEKNAFSVGQLTYPRIC